MNTIRNRPGTKCTSTSHRSASVFFCSLRFWLTTCFERYLDYIVKDNVGEDRIIQFASMVAQVMTSFLGALPDIVQNAIFDCENVEPKGTEIFDTICPEFMKCQSGYNDVCLCSLLEVRENLDPFDQLTLLAGAGFDVTSLKERLENGVHVALDASMDSLYPEESWMLTIPLSVAMLVAILTSLYLALGYLPSITSTTLRLRSGVIPTLDDTEQLNSYRAAVRSKDRGLLAVPKNWSTFSPTHIDFFFGDSLIP